MSCISLVLSQFALQVIPQVYHHKEDFYVMGKIDYSKVPHLGIIEHVIIPRCPAVVTQKALTLCMPKRMAQYHFLEYLNALLLFQGLLP